jgi:hypothetical protein
MVGLVLSRVLVEPGSTPPSVSDEAVLLMKSDAAHCGSAMLPDAGVPNDATSVDAGAPLDAASPDGGAAPDAGTPPDAGTSCPPTVTLVFQPRFTVGSSGSRFAILLVTPFEPTINAEREGLFDELATLTAPVIHVQTVEVEDSSLGTRCSSSSPSSSGCGGGYYSQPRADALPWQPPAIIDAAPSDGPTQMVGPYAVATARPLDATALESWLTQLGYTYTQADMDAVTPYLARNYVVVAVRVAIDGPLDGALVPLALTWAGGELRLPAALGTRPALEPLTAYIAASTRYEFPGADLGFAGLTTSGYLVRDTLSLSPSGSPDTDPVAYSTAGPDYQTVIDQTQEVRVPVTKNCSSDDDVDLGCCPACQTQRTRVRLDWFVVVAAFAWTLRRRSRASRR